MADFEGFICDNCGNVHPNSERTVEVMSFETKKFVDLDKEYVRDLCPECVPKDDELAGGHRRARPKKRGRKKADEPKDAPPSTPDPPTPA